MKLSIKAALAAAPFALIGCSSMPTMSSAPDVPAAIAVPAGNKMSMRTVGVGELTYECREKQGAAGTFEWTFVAPTATLWDANRTKAVGKYYGGPTWESSDGSKVTGKQLAIAPATNAGAIPLQLVQAAPAMGNGVDAGRHLHSASEYGRWHSAKRAVCSIERGSAPAGEVRSRLRFL